MDRKGFTLIELLAVIVILALLAILTTTSVTKVVKDSKNNLRTVQLTNIEEAAKMWGSDHIGLLPNAGECAYMTLGDLKTLGLVDSSITDPTTGAEFPNTMNIKITGTAGTYGNTLITYEVDPENVTGCTYLFEGE